jgi:NAD-dependent deacetylase
LIRRKSESEKLVEKAASIIAGSHRLVAFSGAGVSAESGIPTFRDPGGLWDRYDPYELGGGDLFSAVAGGRGLSSSASNFVSEMIEVLERASPNPGHVALSELERLGILKTVITQNIDNLHREAGNTHVIEVHGNVYRLLCLGCGRRFYLDREELSSLGRKLAKLLEEGDMEGVVELASRCSCGGFCRVDVVGFGEPVQDLGQAVYEAKTADCFLILGTSGEVYPANTLPEHAARSGARVIEINATGCYFPHLVDVSIVARTGEVLPRIVEKVRRLRKGS